MCAQKMDSLFHIHLTRLVRSAHACVQSAVVSVSKSWYITYSFGLRADPLDTSWAPSFPATIRPSGASTNPRADGRRLCCRLACMLAGDGDGWTLSAGTHFTHCGRSRNRRTATAYVTRSCATHPPQLTVACVCHVASRVRSCLARQKKMADSLINELVRCIHGRSNAARLGHLPLILRSAVLALLARTARRV